MATGLNTETGHTTAILQQTGEKKLPLEKELDGIGKIVNIAVLIICVIAFIIGLIQNFSSGNFAAMTLRVLVNSVALAVAAIPEGLPAVATVVVAVGIQRIVQDKIIIKDSDALETLGKTNVICADKTGILTRNKMQLSRIYDGDKMTDVESEALTEKPALVLKLATACSTLRNDPTEEAIKKACLAYNSMSEKDIAGFFPRLGVIPFDSERKTMTVISMINEVLKINDAMAEDALRIVCIAMRPLDSIPANPNPEEIEHGLTFVGLLGIIDPPRDNVTDDIAACKAAGIRTVMITGDNLITAKSIARRIGILTDDSSAVTGEELASLSDEELAQSIKSYSVYARVSPADKTRIVKAWQQNGAVVTVTGDSVQDTEALISADIGCAMGKFGADVARGTADIVISNSRFGSIVCAIKESRGLFDNIRKSVYYLLSCNFAELLSVFIGMLVFSGTPLSAVQLLWINLLTDCAPAISISMEKAEDEVMKRKPYTALGKLFDGKSLIGLAIQSLTITAATLIAFALGRSTGSAAAMTMAFGVLGMSEIFHCYNNRLDGTLFGKRIFANRFLNLSAILTLFILIFLMLTPAGYVFGMTVISAKQFFICLLLAFAIVPVTELIKLVNKNR